MSAAITPIRMPKWGLSMQEGKIVEWQKREGEAVREGEDLVDVETSKITNIYEAPAAGTLRRIVAQAGDTLPVGALLAVMADGAVSDGDIDAYIAEFNANFVIEAAEGGEAGLATREIEAAGSTLRVGMAGQGQDGVPVLLIHGFGGDMQNWTLLMEPLSADRPVYALELPGHGQSQKAVPDASMAGLAKATIAALDALDVKAAHLVGHSMGGAVALAAALAAPGRVASLTLIASAGLPGAAVNPDYLNGFIDARRARDLQPVAEMLFADKAMASKELVEQLSRFKRIDGVEEALSALRDAMLNGDELAGLAKRVGEIAAPLLVIAASADEIVSGPDQSALPKAARFLMIEGAGHLPQIERADAVAAAIKAHIGAA